MSQQHWDRRDAKRARSKGMQVTGRSAFVIQQAQQRRDAATAQSWVQRAQAGTLPAKILS
jgi:hypothetical protein